MDTINASVLELIGISAGTVLGSAFVDAAKPAPSERSTCMGFRSKNTFRKQEILENSRF